MTAELLPASVSTEALLRLRALINPYVWTTDTAKIKLPKTGQLEFSDHRMLVAIYQDLHPDTCWMKAAQLGLSTAALLRAMWAVTTFPLTLIYTFPTQGLVSRYTQTRIDPIIDGSRFLQSRAREVSNVFLKTWRPLYAEDATSSLWFAGAKSENDAIAVDADVLIHDELDFSTWSVIEMFAHRLDNPTKFRWKLRLSTPTLPETGIHRDYLLSDRRRWLIKCPKCNDRFPLTWPACVAPSPDEWKSKTELERAAAPEPYYRCPKCGARLGDDDRLAGAWVAEAPSVGRRGYHLTQMAAPWITARMLLDAYVAETWEGDFYNFRLGEPWESAELRLDEAIIKARQTDSPMQLALAQGRSTMGLDVGVTKKLEAIVGVLDPDRTPRTIAMMRGDSWDLADQWMKDYNVETCVVDWLPDDDAARRFAARWNRPGRMRVWRARYIGQEHKQIEWREADGEVLLPRDRVLTLSANELLTQRRLPKFDGSEAWLSYIEHHRNSKRLPLWQKRDDNLKVLEGYGWKETGPDHLFHAAAYEYVARQAPRPEMIPIVSGIHSMTRGGTRQPAPRRQPRMG